MINYKEIKATWSSGACPPEGIYTDRIYSIVKQNGELCISDGNYTRNWDYFCITTFMSPTDENISWSDVDFEEFDESKKSTNTIESKNFKFNKK